MLRVPGVAGDYDVQMAKNPGFGPAGEAGPGEAHTGRRGRPGRQAWGPGFVFSHSCCVNPLAFHNKSQIINKYMPVMSRLFNRRNWKMRCRVIISLWPRLGSIFPSSSLPRVRLSQSLCREAGSDPTCQLDCRVEPLVLETVRASEGVCLGGSGTGGCLA